MANNKQKEDKMPRMFSTLKEAHDVVNYLESEVIKWQHEAFDRADLISQLQAEVKKLKSENMCDACAGDPSSVLDGNCMCQGTGKMSRAAEYLRDQLFITKRDLNNLLAVIHRDGGHHTEKFGQFVSTGDAYDVVCDMRNKEDELKTEIARLTATMDAEIERLSRCLDVSEQREDLNVTKQIAEERNRAEALAARYAEALRTSRGVDDMKTAQERAAAFADAHCGLRMQFVEDRLWEAFAEAMADARRAALTDAIHAMEEPGVMDWAGCVARVDYLRKNPSAALAPPVASKETT